MKYGHKRTTEGTKERHNDTKKYITNEQTNELTNERTT